MNFSIPISNRSSLYLGFHDDVQDTPEPFHRLYDLYSKHRTQSPKSVVPNISCVTQDTLVGDDGRCNPLAFSPTDSHSWKEDIQHAYEHGLYLQHLLRFEHFHCCKSESANHDNALEYRLVKQHNDTWLPKLCDNLDYLQYETYNDILTYCKDKSFIQTKVAAMKLQGFIPK